MNEEIKKIREYIKCPQFGYAEYGKWGALNLEQRKAFKRLCDYIESSDNYITNLQKENQKLKEGIDTLNVQIGTYKYICNDNKKMAENYKKENQKLVKVIDGLEKWLSEKQDLTCGCGITRDYIYAYENVLDKLTELKGGDKDVENTR